MACHGLDIAAVHFHLRRLFLPRGGDLLFARRRFLFAAAFSLKTPFLNSTRPIFIRLSSFVRAWAHALWPNSE